jgi:hypothetical protein
MPDCTYLLPIRRGMFNRAEAEAMRSYLATVQPAVSEILVVDGSPDDVFAAHDEAWSGICRHERVDRQFGFLNDKVNGIQTGVRLAETNRIILADDDIRYSPDQIGQVARLLEKFDVVRPQNYFGAVTTWWAKTEAARMLINRATLRIADYPGTCAFRRDTMLAVADYDGDVLFDNEELIRHLARSGARIAYGSDLFIQKDPPKFRKWIEQRPRQAYEDFGLRTKTVLFAALPLLLISIFIVFGFLAALLVLAGLTILSITLSTLGWFRGAARSFFPFRICLFAPLWVFERSFSTYWAFYWFLRKRGYPFGDQLLQKGIGRDWVEGGRIASQNVTALRENK